MILEILSIALAAITAVGQPLLLVLLVILVMQLVQINNMKLKAASRLGKLADTFEAEAKKLKKESKHKKVGE